MEMFSESFERKICEMVKKMVEEAFEDFKRSVVPTGYIKQKDVLKFYKGIDVDTLTKYEKLGLKRHRPVEGGLVWYKISELESFMDDHVEIK